MNTTSWAYSNKREGSVRKEVYHILSDLKVRCVFPAVHFVSPNAPEEKAQVLLSEKELLKLPGDSPNIFKKLNYDWYIDRPNASSSDGVQWFR